MKIKILKTGKNKEDKLVFEAGTPKTFKQHTAVHPKIRVSNETYEMLTEIACKTGMTLVDVASKMVKYAYAHSEIQNNVDERKK